MRSYTITQAAAVLGVHRDTVDRWWRKSIPLPEGWRWDVVQGRRKRLVGPDLAPRRTA